MPRSAKQKSLAVLAVALFLGACAVPAQRPIWLDTPAAAAPAGWWAATGFGATPAEAHNDALTRLAQRVEARVHAVERVRGSRFDRAATVRTDVALTGAVQLAAHAANPCAALVALNPTAAARAIAERADAALSAAPPRITKTLVSQIEQGAVMDPSAADWPALRARVYNGLAALPPAQIDAPDAVAHALREAFGPALVRAQWSERPAPSHRPGQRLRAWTLTADVGGEPRRWGGVVADADPAAAAAARVRAATMDE